MEQIFFQTTFSQYRYMYNSRLNNINLVIKSDLILLT
jgi:hypothetical protein